MDVAGILVAAVAAAADTDPDDRLESIVVVGQKENLGTQRTPEAITALPADFLKENNIRTPGT